MKKIALILTAALLLTSSLMGCQKNDEKALDEANATQTVENEALPEYETTEQLREYKGIYINLSDEEITVDNDLISEDPSSAVYTARDIVYYEEGKDFTYGEGEEGDAHSKEEADAHTVVHITKAGQYVLSGSLSKGQIAVDLGDDAESDSEAVVTLVLNNVDIICEVAPAVIFYNVYECGTADTETATKDVDTSQAGANVIIADNTENTINGSYVARIYKPDSVVLSEDGAEIADAKKLHKYDAAFYSKKTMNINGGEAGNGILNINAANEGLDTELHLTINGGIINIDSGNDGINTNEDYVSVTTVNGGKLNIHTNGATGEGDGIDSNGWLVINGGVVYAEGCDISGDAGIDSDMGIYINGGEVFATGNMLDRISESKQSFAVFNFTQTQRGGHFALKNSENSVIIENDVTNAFTYLIASSEAMADGDYSLWNGEVQLKGIKSEEGGKGGMIRPEGMKMPEGIEKPEMPEGFDPDMTPPEGFDRGERPEGMQIPEEMERPEGMELPENIDPNMRPDDDTRPDRPMQDMDEGELSEIFTITEGANYFVSVTDLNSLSDNTGDSL